MARFWKKIRFLPEIPQKLYAAASHGIPMVPKAMCRMKLIEVPRL